MCNRECLIVICRLIYRNLTVFVAGRSGRERVGGHGPARQLHADARHGVSEGMQVGGTVGWGGGTVDIWWA